MKEHWHEPIQRYVAGDSTQEETAALQQALKADAGLRALYLDYLNLDLALGAVAEAAPLAGKEIGGPVSPSHSWHLLAATAVCIALVTMTILHGRHDAPGARHDFGGGISSAENAVARLSTGRASSFPEWMSPTASMLSAPLSPE